MAKYGMSLCVLGMAEEFRAQGIAVNALWPRTAIDTEAIRLIAGQAARGITRSTAIMADAAHWILTQPSRASTGRFWIDEEAVREAGVTDLSRYRGAGRPRRGPDAGLLRLAETRQRAGCRRPALW